MTTVSWAARRILVVTMMVAPLIAMPVPSALAQVPAQPPAGAPPSFADLADRLLPAVVNISTTQTIKSDNKKTEKNSKRAEPEMPQFPPGSPFEDFFKDFFENQNRSPSQQAPRKATSLGSGFIIDSAGYIVTNNHVIDGADEITVILHDDTNLKAKLVGRDTKTDMALLKVEAEKPLPFVPWGDSDKMRVGDWVLAIGNPFGLGGTVTAGIISARARDINAGPYDDFIQTDASINRGNSGGPMFNTMGEVIGINTAIFSPSGGSVGIGFAIPSNLSKSVIQQLRDHGKTRRGWLGVRIQAVTPEIAESLGLPNGARGALIASVTPKGPAEEGGIQQGDIVLSFNGHPVEDMRRLPRVVAETDVEKTVPVTVWRKGKEVAVSIKVGELEAAEESGMLDDEDGGNKSDSKSKTEASQEILGLTVTKITDAAREKYTLSAEAKGVLITEVKDDSTAASMDLRAGDLIVEVNQEEVSSPDDMKAKIDAARKAGRKSVLLLVNRQNDRRFVALQIGE